MEGRTPPTTGAGEDYDDLARLREIQTGPAVWIFAWLPQSTAACDGEARDGSVAKVDGAVAPFRWKDSWTPSTVQADPAYAEDLRNGVPEEVSKCVWGFPSSRMQAGGGSTEPLSEHGSRPSLTAVS